MTIQDDTKSSNTEYYKVLSNVRKQSNYVEQSKQCSNCEITGYKSRHVMTNKQLKNSKNHSLLSKNKDRSVICTSNDFLPPYKKFKKHDLSIWDDCVSAEVEVLS